MNDKSRTCDGRKKKTQGQWYVDTEVTSSSFHLRQLINFKKDKFLTPASRELHSQSPSYSFNLIFPDLWSISITSHLAGPKLIRNVPSHCPLWLEGL